MRINFLSESGVDAGGLHREGFMMLKELLTNTKSGLFKVTQGGDLAFFLNSNSRYDNGEGHLIYYYGAGRLLGGALLECKALNFHLSFISVIYIFIFLRYTTDRKQTLKVIAVYAAVLSIIIAYAVLGGLGVISTIKDVLKYKTGIFIPIHMVIAGTFNNTMWIIYTPMAKLWFLLVTNACCATIGVAQLTVYMIYHPSKHPLGHGATLEDLLKKEKEDNNDTQSISIDRRA
ncbi:hypothetical protein PF005_g23621 [Phytophthora fragariae]|uniref:HECT domain-containing protein n=2 Tax=Phytophthora fragariae TaxID=53985 RepID=A0A6A3DUA6_9STRA|nr:hypothetical protein PF009_g24368 [Phytophthora fragariae]KAE8980503.1 hypothetical protein PF011_g22416 [Phytophthora fragariae]KAE9179601.1 hypothetical protein PF005_g23621 [Phytophthora fragariae]